jgi:broad specificity phosphatase PhoE
MNTKDKNISNAAGDRHTYLSPCVQIIKMETTNPLAESLGIPRTDEDTKEAYGKQWQGDDLDSWDEEDANNENNWGSGW